MSTSSPHTQRILERLRVLHETLVRARESFKENTDRLVAEVDAIIKKLDAAHLEEELEKIEREALEDIERATQESMKRSAADQRAAEPITDEP